MAFSKRKNTEKDKKEAVSRDLPKDSKLTQEINELSTIGGRRDLSRADTEVKEAVSKAAKTDIKNILLIEQGRCPVCYARTENFLFTVVCPSCGWFRREVPSRGRSLVYLKNGDTIDCDYVHHSSRDEYLCIKDGVVISEISRSEVRKIDYLWERGELEEARILAHKLKSGICSWCEGSLEETAEEEHGEDYVAFGAFQERYIFCSEKCQRAFRKHYPARIHRNCYETDCNTCGLCVKRYDTHGFKRSILQ